MNSTTRRALPALLLTAIVLAVAFAGGAAAAKLITGKDIKNNSVTTRDIKTNTLKSTDIKNGNVAEADLSAAAKAKLNAPNVAGYEVKSQKMVVGTAGQETVFVACTKGKVAIGGVGTWGTTEFDAVIQESAPQKVIGDFFAPADPNFADAWRITGQHNGLDATDLTAYVICVDPS